MGQRHEPTPIRYYAFTGHRTYNDLLNIVNTGQGPPFLQQSCNDEGLNVTDAQSQSLASESRRNIQKYARSDEPRWFESDSPAHARTGSGEIAILRSSLEQATVSLASGGFVIHALPFSLCLSFHLLKTVHSLMISCYDQC